MSRAGVMKGVPASEDVGVVYLMVRAVGPHAHHYSKDIFAIDVIKPGLDSVVPENLNKVRAIEYRLLIEYLVVETNPSNEISHCWKYRPISPDRFASSFHFMLNYFLLTLPNYCHLVQILVKRQYRGSHGHREQSRPFTFSGNFPDK